MVTQNDIINAVNAQLVAKLTGIKQVHINVCPMPKDFERPSALIEIPDDDQTDVGRNTVSRSIPVSITYYDTVDERQLSDIASLNSAKEKIMAIFAPGYIRVGDRALKVTRCKGSVGFSDTAVDAQLGFFDDRGIAAETLPMMAEINTNLKQEG